MIVTFVGCANSGKTTTAAMLFSALKRHGMSSEFISEQARVYIARKRLQDRGFYPDDWDQLQIMRSQQDLIRVMERSTIEADAIVVCDSSPLNALLYMSPDARLCYEVRQLLEELEANENAVTFYAPPVPRSVTLDPNRLHSEEASLAVDRSIPEIMSKHVPKTWQNTIPLVGDPGDRYLISIGEVLRRRVQGVP